MSLERPPKKNQRRGKRNGRGVGGGRGLYEREQKGGEGERGGHSEERGREGLGNAILKAVFYVVICE